MTGQARLFDLPAGAQLATEAIGRVRDHADGDWLDTAYAVVLGLADTGEPFTTDQVWLGLDGTDAATHEPRAMGAVIRRAVAAGVIRGTGEYRRSARPECHCNPKAVWRGA